jgi:hypothetical protein
VRYLMRERRVIALAVPEEIDAGHVHVVGRWDVASPASAMHDVSGGRREKCFGPFDARHGLGARRGFGVIKVIQMGEA